MCGGSILSCFPRNSHGHERALKEERTWRARACSFVFTQRFFLQMSQSIYFFANNSKTVGRRKLKFSHNVGLPTKANVVRNFELPGHVTKILRPKIKKLNVNKTAKKIFQRFAVW